MINGYFSLERHLEESLSTDFESGYFIPEYKANLYLREIQIGKLGINLATFTQREWYDIFSKYEMSGGRILLSFGTDSDSFTLFADVANRTFFDVLIPPEYSPYEDGTYLKLGILSFDKGFYFKIFTESAKNALLNRPKIGLFMGFEERGLQFKAGLRYDTSLPFVIKIKEKQQDGTLVSEAVGFQFDIMMSFRFGG